MVNNLENANVPYKERK